MTRTKRKIGIAMLLAFTATEAGAIIGGTDGGPLNGATLMVLNDRGGVCTGIILERDAVLTAGHCVAGAGQVRLHWRAPGEPILKEPASVVLHPGYNGRAIAERTRSIDLALIRLKEPLPNEFAAANLLAGAQPRAGAKLTVAGYGLAREGDARSSGTYRSASLDVVEPYGPGKLLLWASNATQAGACTGDSGGPMISGSGSIAAVTTWSEGKAKARCGALTQGVLVAPQRAWIDRTLKGWGRRANWVE
jgi:Trypsin